MGIAPDDSRESILIPQFNLAPAGPIRRIDILCDKAVKRRVGPIRHALYQTMFHRVDVHVIHVRLIVAFIPDRVCSQ